MLLCLTLNTGSVIGLPPEVRSAKAGNNVTVDYSKSDVWAIGCIGYQLIGQEHPWSSLDPRTAQSPPSLAGHCSRHYESLLAGMLTHKFEDRFTAGRAIDVIRKMLWKFPNNPEEIATYIVDVNFSVIRPSKICLERSLLVEHLASKVTEEVMQILTRNYIKDSLQHFREKREAIYYSKQ